MPAGDKTKQLWESKEYKERMSNSHKGKKHSEETKAKMRKAQKNRKRNGKIIMQCGICGTEFERYKSQKSIKYCSKECRTSARKKQMVGNVFAKGNKLTDKHKQIISEFISKTRNQEDNPNWKGGRRREYKILYGSKRYKEWRKTVFERDDYTCKDCGARNGNGKYIRLEAHHIMPWCDYESLRFDINNCLTLCKKCHDKTKKGVKTSNKKRIRR